MRERARRRLIDFTCYLDHQYVADPVHRLIASYLDAVIQGKCKRLMIFAPPQSGKSTLTSVYLPGFWLGHYPDEPIIMASYGADLAETNGWLARQKIESKEYQDLFPDVRTDESSRARDNWRLAGKRGALLAVGVGGAATGRGMRLGIIDDPFKGREDAYSETMRQKVWNWWQWVFRPRLWENGAIVLIQTRWHERDLAGMLLEESREDWEVLRLPALAETQEERDENNKRLGIAAGMPDPLGREPGQSVSPTRFSIESLEKTRDTSSTSAWYALYQGTPRAEGGNLFDRSWFEIHDAAPAQFRRVVRYWDKAGTAAGGAYTCGVLMAVTSDKVYWVLDVVRGQWASSEREQVIKNTAVMDKQKWHSVQVWLEQEPGSGGLESADNTVRNLAGFTVRKEPVRGDKVLRAEPLEAQARVGNVKLLKAAWNWQYLEELTAFPNGRYADQVDASSGAFNKLATGGVFVG